jgi:hypothetical protein
MKKATARIRSLIMLVGLLRRLTIEVTIWLIVMAALISTVSGALLK